MKYGKLVAAAATALAVAAMASNVRAAEFYAGKTVTIISPVAGGSGLDRLARAFARYWPKYIPGKPKIIVKNMPGGGFVKALNYTYERAKPDGMTVYWGPWKPSAVLSGQPGLRYIPEKFELIGTGGSYYITLIRTDVAPGIKNPIDVLKSPRFSVGGRSATLVIDVLGNLSMEMLGVKYRFVPGYRGMNKIRPAIAANEVQAVNSGHVGYHVFFKDNEIKSGKVTALWYHPVFDINGNPATSSAFPGVSSFVDVYRQVHGKAPSGPDWEAYKWYASVPASMSMSVFAPPGTPKAAVAALRKGHAATTRDKEYNASMTKRIGAPLRFISVEQGRQLLNSYRNVPPEVKAVFDRMSKVGQK